MLNSALSNGYSSEVRGWLVIDGVRHELAQVGPGFCILREPISSRQFSCDGNRAELVIEVDGNERKVDILLAFSQASAARRLQFRKVQPA